MARNSFRPSDFKPNVDAGSSGQQAFQAAPDYTEAAIAEEAARKRQERDVLRLEVATYIQQMSTELGNMARASDMPLLSYFLEMASAEAREITDKLGLALYAEGAHLTLAQDEART